MKEKEGHLRFRKGIDLVHAGFLKYVFPFAWHTSMQSFWIACLICSSVSATTGIHVMFCSSNRLMYRSVLRVSLCPSSYLTNSSLPLRW